MSPTRLTPPAVPIPHPVGEDVIGIDPARPIRIVIIDDHLLFREGLRAVLASEPGIVVVGEAANADAAYEAVAAHNPDIALLDIAMPGPNGVSVARELRRRTPSCELLMLSMHAQDQFIQQAFAAGASGYAIKEQSLTELTEAIRAVARRETYLPPHVAPEVVEEARRLRRGESVRSHDPLEPLSRREREIFDELVRGRSNQEIAGKLCISVKTVETHRSHVLKKLDLHSVTDLVRLAVRHGILPD